jgi:hypothetical protein
MSGSDQAVKAPKSTDHAQIEELGYIESYDAVVDKMYAYVAYKETKPTKETWRLCLKGSVTSATFVDPFHSAFKSALQKAVGRDETSLAWGYGIEPKESDPRRVELRVLLTDGKPSGVQMTLVTRKADGSAREPEVLTVGWPAGE